MNVITRLLKLSKSNLSLVALYSVLITVLAIILISGYWQKPRKVIYADVQEYYSYLPAVFIFHDISTLSAPFELRKNHLWSSKSPIGKPVFKFTMGLSFLYAPFFLAAQFYSYLTGSDTMGFGPPYKFALLMSSFFFLIIGLIFLRKILLKYYSDTVTALTLIGVVIGTNMLYYTALRAAMSHVYTFALFTLFIWNTIKWYEFPKTKTSIFLGLLTGLISLIRPSDIIIILFFVFYGISGDVTFKRRILFLLKKYKQILLMVFFGFIVWLPQMIYWKTMAGSWLYYSYGTQEGFFFTNPQILNSLFSYHNGWLLYTPIMIFALSGIGLLYKKRRDYFLPVLIFTVFNIWILSSWWCWWFVGFGNRAYIESYALLSIPLAEFITFVVNYRKKAVRYVFFSVFVFFIFLNSFQVWQYSHQMGHFDGMSKKAYWSIFLNPKAKGRYYKYLERPDYSKAKKGVYIFGDKE